MPKVQQATVVPTSTGDEIRATLQLGRQELTSQWPIEDDEEIQSLLEHLLVRVQQVTFASSPNGGEIRADLRVGDRVFVSRLPVDGEDQELKPALDRLLEAVGEKIVANLMSELGYQTSGAESTAGGGSRR